MSRDKASQSCPPVLSPTDGNDGVGLDIVADLKLAGFFMSIDSGRARSSALISVPAC